MAAHRKRSRFRRRNAWLDAITRRARTGTVDFVLLVLLVGVAASAPAMLDAGAPPLVIVVALAAGSQVAGLALWNRVCAAVAGRDARRYLPRAGAAVTAGGAMAGLGSGALIPRIGLDAIPWIGAAVTVLVIVIALIQQRSLDRHGAPGAGAAAAAAAELPPVQRSLIAAMTVVAALEGIVTTVIDLQFIASVKARYSGEDLAVALALFYGGTNAILFLLQSAAVPRLLVTRSLPFTAAIHPVVVILAYAGFAAAPGFVGIAGTRTADQVLRFATSRTSQELSLSALPPGPRARYKVLLRGSLWPAGAALAALVLLLVGPQPPTRLALLAIVVAIVWAIAARVAARRFQTALAAPLGIKQTRVDDPRTIDLDTLERWTHAAGSDDPRIAALARAAIARARVDATDLADHLRHDEPAVRAALFDQLARSPNLSLRGELRAALAIEDDDRALALGIKALALAGDDAGITRGEARPGLSREVDEAVQSARVMLHDGGIGRGEAQLRLSREVDEAVQSGRLMLPDADARAVVRSAAATTAKTATTSPTTTKTASASPTNAVSDELHRLLARDPAWAAALLRVRPGALLDDMLDAQLRDALANPTTRAGAFVVIARVGPELSRPLLAAALEAGDADALATIGDLDAPGATSLAESLSIVSPLAKAAAGATSLAESLSIASPLATVAAGATSLSIVSARSANAPPATGAPSTFSPLARAVLARTLAGATAGGDLIAKLLRDRDPEVAYAALRSALALVRGGGKLPVEDIEGAYDAALAAFIAHLDARDAVATAWSACARKELEIATRRCAARVLWATAVEAATAGRDPGPIAASARHLTGGTEAERKRALDVVQELQARPQLLAMIERWLGAPNPSERPHGLDDHDPWLVRLGTGQLPDLEPMLVELRRPALFASVAGPALGALAERCERRTIDGELFRAGDAGDTMVVVSSGELVATRGSEQRKVGAGEVLGELAVLTNAPRAATVSGKADVIVVERAAVSAAARRAPELVLGLAATLAGWLAPNRPDVL